MDVKTFVGQMGRSIYLYVRVCVCMCVCIVILFTSAKVLCYVLFFYFTN